MSESAATGQRMRGQCLCGAVQFEVDVPERTYSVCHCGICPAVSIEALVDHRNATGVPLLPTGQYETSAPR